MHDMFFYTFFWLFAQLLFCASGHFFFGFAMDFARRFVGHANVPVHPGPDRHHIDHACVYFLIICNTSSLLAAGTIRRMDSCLESLVTWQEEV